MEIKYSDNSNIYSEWVTTIDGCNTWGDYQVQVPYIGDPLSPYNDGTAPWVAQPVITYPYVELNKPDPGEEIEKMFRKYLKEKKPEEVDNIMKIYEVIVIDAKECEILKKQDVVAKDTETAMLELSFGPEALKRIKKGEIKFIFNEKGEFTKFERKIKVKELTEED